MDGRNWNWNCNWNWNNVVDVSPFLLFESTGDSEANSDLNMASLSTGDNMEVTTYEVDDAQSCCSNLSDSFCDCNHHDQDQDQDQDQEYAQCSKKKSKKKDQDYPKCPKKRCKKKDQEYAQCSRKKEHEYANYDGYNPNYRDYNYNDDDDDDEDDGAIDQDWTCGKMGFVVSKQKQKQNKKNKSKVSTVEPVKEEEKDKLFWDTCLGS